MSGRKDAMIGTTANFTVYDDPDGFKVVDSHTGSLRGKVGGGLFTPDPIAHYFTAESLHEIAGIVERLQGVEQERVRRILGGKI